MSQYCFQPFPLFTKIEPAVAETLKAKYAGRQKSQTPEKSEVKVVKAYTTTKITSKIEYEESLTSLEEAVAKQVKYFNYCHY